MEFVVLIDILTWDMFQLGTKLMSLPQMGIFRGMVNEVRRISIIAVCLHYHRH